MTKKREKPVVWIKSAIYQPNKAELEEDMSIDATPGKLAAVALRPVGVKVIGKDK